MSQKIEHQHTPTAERRLHGKVAVITGASTGIGESTARELARLGASVVLTARRIDLLEKIAREIEATGGKALPLVADTTKLEDLRRMVQIAVDHYGRLDYAVNNAGIGGGGEFLDIGEEDFSRVMETNVRGVFLAMQAEIPALLQGGGGAIVNVASVAGIVGIPGISAYVASKHAVIGLTKSVALEYAVRNIRINALAPGTTETAIYDHAPRELKDRLVSYTAMKRWADPIEMARAIIYLLADVDIQHGHRALCRWGAISLLTVGIPHQGGRFAVGRLAIYPSHSEKEFRLLRPPKDGNPAISFGITVTVSP